MREVRGAKWTAMGTSMRNQQKDRGMVKDPEGSSSWHAGS